MTPAPHPGSEPRRGFSVLELVVIVALVVLLGLLALPTLLRLTGGLRVRLAAAEVSSAMRLARSYAIRNNAKVALKFYPQANRVRFALYRDGDGDGVRNDDLRRGIDPRVTPLRTLSHLGRRVRFGFPAGEPPIAPGKSGRRLDRLEDPIRFNRSDLASFSPLGGATTGTVYLTDGHHLAAVRIYNRTGKIMVLVYDRRRDRWR